MEDLFFQSELCMLVVEYIDGTKETTRLFLSFLPNVSSIVSHSDRFNSIGDTATLRGYYNRSEIAEIIQCVVEAKSMVSSLVNSEKIIREDVEESTRYSITKSRRRISDSVIENIAGNISEFRPIVCFCIECGTKGKLIYWKDYFVHNRYEMKYPKQPSECFISNDEYAELRLQEMDQDLISSKQERILTQCSHLETRRGWWHLKKYRSGNPKVRKYKHRRDRDDLDSEKQTSSTTLMLKHIANSNESHFWENHEYHPVGRMMGPESDDSNQYDNWYDNEDQYQSDGSMWPSTDDDYERDLFGNRDSSDDDERDCPSPAFRLYSSKL